MMRFILPSNRKSRQGRRSFRPALDALEGRQLLSMAPVFSVRDYGISNIGAYPGSLQSNGQVRLDAPVAKHGPGNITAYSPNGKLTALVSGTGSGANAAIGDSNGNPTSSVLPFIGGGNFVFPHAINDQGEVVGTGLIGDGWDEAYLYKDGTSYDIGSLIGYPPRNGNAHIYNAVDINDSGQILVVYENNGGQYGYEVLTPVQQTPIVTWYPPNAITYGTPLSATQLDANSLVPGTFAYTLADGKTPADGAVLHAGAAQTLNVTFTPDDLVDYTTVTLTNTIRVLPVDLSIALDGPSPITYGTALGADQLNAKVEVQEPFGALHVLNSAESEMIGTFTYTLADGKTPAFGAILHAGNQRITRTFTPYDPVDYTTVTQTATLDVLKAPMTVTTNNASVLYGQPIPALTGTVAGLVNGDSNAFIFTTTATKGTPPGQYTISPTPPASPGLDYNDYAISFTTGTLTISNPTIAGLTLSAAGDLQIIGQLPSGNVVNVTPGAPGWVQVTDNGVSAAFAASSVHYIHYLGSLSGYDTFRTSFVPDGYTYAQVYGRNNLIANQTTSGLAYWSINGEFNMLVTMGTTNAINDVMTTGPRYTDAFYGLVVFLN